MKTYTLYFDGGCKPNKLGTFGVVIKEKNQDKSKHILLCGTLGPDRRMTSNIAEYYGLLNGLKYLDKITKGEKYVLHIKGDSKMVIKMVKKEWGWKGGMGQWNPHPDFPHLKTAVLKVMDCLKGKKHRVKWIPRDRNKKADWLSNKAYAFYKQNKQGNKLYLVDIQGKVFSNAEKHLV